MSPKAPTQLPLGLDLYFPFQARRGSSSRTFHPASVQYDAAFLHWKLPVMFLIETLQR